MINKILTSLSLVLALSSTAMPMEFPLHKAAESGSFEQLCALLKQNPTGVNEKDNNDWTPLHSAVEYGHLECVQVLLQHQANVNEKNNLGLTPLHIAAAKGRRECVEELLKNDADITAKTVFGKTAKDIAKASDHHHIVKLLDEYDAEERRTQMHNQKLKKIMCDFCDDFFSSESIRKVGKNDICRYCLGISNVVEVIKD